MKAIVYTQYGTPDVLHLKEVEKPALRKNEVLIKVHAASINSWDWDLLSGKPMLVRLIGGITKPAHQVLGADIAGTVVELGNEASQFKMGDEVIGDIAGNGFGGFAEYVAVPEKLLAKKSPQMTFEQAAALPQAGLLALQGLHYKGSIAQGQQVLINGAGGGVGTLALQYAKNLGAEVTCVDRAEKFDLLRSLGADHLIDYTKEDYTKRGIRYDRVLDVIAYRKASDYKRVLKPGGTFAMIGGSMGGLLARMMLLEPVLSNFRSRKLGIMGYRPNRRDLDNLGQLFDQGILTPVIDKIYPLNEVADAFRHFGTGRVCGKIVISI